MNRTQREQYVEWISQYRWSLFCVFTFRQGIRFKAAKKLFASFIRQVELCEGKRLSWIYFSESSGNGLHFHVLAAGIRSRF